MGATQNHRGAAPGDRAHTVHMDMAGGEVEYVDALAEQRGRGHSEECTRADFARELYRRSRKEKIGVNFHPPTTAAPPEKNHQVASSD